MSEIRDCIVVGGGAAGLSAAIVLGRARKDTLMVDAGNQSNLAAHGIGGLLGYDGRSPAELYAAGRRELEAYGSVEVRDGMVVAGSRSEEGFALQLDAGETVRARAVLLATGMEYRRPDLPGIAERWGGTVFHCPFCHGWEVRDRALGVLTDGAKAVHAALMLRGWSERVTVYPGPEGEFESDERAQLEGAGVAIDEREVTEVRGEDDDQVLAFADGGEAACGGLMVPAPLYQRSSLAEELGATLVDAPPMVFGKVQLDEQFGTGVPGLYAAGDNVASMQSVAAAVASGHAAAAVLVRNSLMSVAAPA